MTQLRHRHLMYIERLITEDQCESKVAHPYVAIIMPVAHVQLTVFKGS